MTRDAQALSRLVLARGARAAERRLLEEIEAALPRGDVAAPPIVVVVPSASLRTHLLGRLAERRSAWLGLEILTLTGLVAAILERTGGAPPSGEALEATLTARLAAREPALARGLGGLVDGYGAIGGAVRDLLDAGFVDEHLEAVEERLDEERPGAGSGAVERAKAIARVAAGVVRELAALGLVPRSGLVTEATRRLEDDPERALPCRAAFVHGIHDATGLHGDLLTALLRLRRGVAIVDLPPEIDGRAADWRFGTRLRERWSGISTVETDERELPASTLSVRRAADPAREARAAVAWLGAAGATPPEASGLVARDLDDLSLVLRELDRQGIAGSAEGGLPGPVSRRAAAWIELLARGDETSVGVALALAGESIADAARVPLADLRLAFTVLGARTLGEAVRLSARRAPVRLPVRDRIAPTGSGDATARRRSVSGEALAAAAGRLEALLQVGRAAATTRNAGEHATDLRRWIGRHVPESERDLLLEPLAGFGAPIVAQSSLTPEEWRNALAAAWRGLAAAPCGHGAGVALLTVTEARGRTFGHLAVTGLSRDRFPRAVRPDPLLPDALRIRLRELLPDLPVKGEGHDEERFLFAQLLAASESVTLFVPVADVEGRSRPPSPLVDELLRARGLAVAPAELPATPSALDVAIVAALAGEETLDDPLSAAVAEADDRFGPTGRTDAATIAAARIRLLDARSADPRSADASHLGPYLGLTGALVGRTPEPRPPSVTRLESLARCGWRLFLENQLGLAPLPEPGEALPALPRSLVGRTVHAVLERLWPGERGRTLADALAEAPRTVEWPSDENLEALTRDAARRELEEAAVDPRLFEASLLREARTRLELARALEWPDGRRDLLGVEVGGDVRVVAAQRERLLGFRADRVERDGTSVVLTDYKTGRPLLAAVTPGKRAEQLAAKIAAGEALQLPVYLLGLPEGTTGRARYLFLDPREEDDRRLELALDGAGIDREALAATLDTLYGSWDAGAFVPRLLTAKLETYSGCAFCDVREACLQGDSSARLRFERWATADPTTDRAEERPARIWFELAGTARAAPEGDDA